MVSTSRTSRLLEFYFLVGGHEYQVQCKAMARTFHYVGVEREAKNFELFMDYNVNNVPGYGMVEWNYRNLE